MLSRASPPMKKTRKHADFAQSHGRPMSAAEHAYLREMRGAPFAAYRWSGSTALGGHPAAGATHYGVVAEHVLSAYP